MSRVVARKKFTMEEFKNSMQGIYSSSICEEVLNECPMAYKPIQEIMANIKEA